MPITIIDFSDSDNRTVWNIVDDVVMGGRSSGNFTLNTAGNGLFYGKVSTENYGGFSSVRFRFPRIHRDQQARIVLRLKGDGKNYQLRIKDNSQQYYSYTYTFKTSGDWETIVVPLEEMYPTFRGRRLNLANFSEDHIEEIGILIGNKRNETFQLEIDKVILK